MNHFAPGLCGSGPMTYHSGPFSDDLGTCAAVMAYIRTNSTIGRVHLQTNLSCAAAAAAAAEGEGRPLGVDIDFRGAILEEFLNTRHE